MPRKFIKARLPGKEKKKNQNSAERNQIATRNRRTRIETAKTDNWEEFKPIIQILLKRKIGFIKRLVQEKRSKKFIVELIRGDAKQIADRWGSPEKATAFIELALERFDLEIDSLLSKKAELPARKPNVIRNHTQRKRKKPKPNTETTMYRSGDSSNRKRRPFNGEI
ncbi:MAG: hypothetical protein Q7S21_06850 [archaeon]|nr:hypothetical protein [archaeon]